METEEDGVTKRYNNPSWLWDILFPVVVVLVAVIAFLGYLSLPTIFNLVQVFTAWFDWLCSVIRNLFFGLVFVNALIFLIPFLSPKNFEKHKPKHTYDRYFSTAVDQYISSAVRPLPENHFQEREVEKYYNNPCYKECKCYDRVVMEQEEEYRKSYRRSRSEKKSKTVEYRRIKAERVTKTSSFSMDVLSSEEFRMTVETFIMERKKMMSFHQNGFADPRLTGFFDQYQTGFPNGFVDQWRTGGVPNQWHNGGIPNQWQELPDDGATRLRHHHSRNNRLQGAPPGSRGSSSGSHLAISN